MRGRRYNRIMSKVKARHKRNIDINVKANSSTPEDISKADRPNPMFDNLHQYSKNSVSKRGPKPKTRNKGERTEKNYFPSINYKAADVRKLDSMADDENEIFI